MRPSLLDEVEVEVLQEGLVGAIMIGIVYIVMHQLNHKLNLHHKFQHASFYLVH